MIPIRLDCGKPPVLLDLSCCLGVLSGVRESSPRSGLRPGLRQGYTNHIRGTGVGTRGTGGACRRGTRTTGPPSVDVAGARWSYGVCLIEMALEFLGGAVLFRAVEAPDGK